MKEDKLIEMRNKIEAQTRIMQEMMHKISVLENLIISVMEVIKRLGEYEKIAEQLNKELNDKKANTKETN